MMKIKNKIRWIIILFSGFFLFLDQFLKYQATHNWSEAKLISKYFGWKPFLNTGAAFSLPLQNWTIILLTLFIIGLVVYLMVKEYNNKFSFVSWTLIITGAISNLFDRIFYKHVIDYLALVTGIINIADVLIIAGLLIYVYKIINSKSQITNKSQI